MENFKISANIIDVINREIYPGTVEVSDGKISSIIKEAGKKYDTYILPGLIDSHIHIESSMLIPSEFAMIAVTHGTVATASDPHEIANVLGIKGVRYMINNGRKTPFKFFFGAPSCVPATTFETAGAVITADDIRKLFAEDKLHYLSEMMNYPGVLFNDATVMEKIKIAKEFKKPIDGHAPGLMGEDAKKYISAGITTDHECFKLDEALDKINDGEIILIREGSAAKNFDTLHTLIDSHTSSVMLCSDDKHPDDLILGHINQLVKRALKYGHDLFNILTAVCVNPVKHYNLNVGLLREGDDADFIVIDNPDDFNILATYIKGSIVAEKGESLIKKVEAEIINNFNAERKDEKDFTVKEEGDKIRVIEALEGQLITNELVYPAKITDGEVVPDLENDILKITVVERYKNGKPAVAFIKNFGLKKGAIASSVAHDSHNIIAVGTTDEEICKAVNTIIDMKGGICAVYDDNVEVLNLPVAGIMTNEDGYSVAQKYSGINSITKKLGTNFNAPFMTLSFMALLVIPSLKLSDKGLFNGNKFEFTSLFV